MIRTRRGSVPGRCRLPSSLLVATLLAGCLTPSDGPNQFGEVRVRPAFTVGEEPDSVRIDIDSMRTTIRRTESAEAPLVDRVLPYSAAEARAWILELRSVAENVGVELELLAKGEVVYRGSRELTVQEGSIGRTSAEDVPVVYVGPIFADSVEIAPPRVVFGALGLQRQMTATAYDRSGNVLAGKVVAWSSRDPSIARIAANGLLTAVGTGSVAIVAAVDGVQDTAFVLVETTLARTTTIVADANTLVADGTSTSRVTVTVRDAGGVAVGASAGTVTLTTTLGTLSAVTDHDDGSYSATLTSGLASGPAIITGTLNAEAINDSAVVQFVDEGGGGGGGGGGSGRRTIIRADSASLVADGLARATVTVSVLDSTGNLLGSSAGGVTLATPLGSLGAVTDHQDGRYTATFTAGTKSGTAVITGKLDGAPIADSALITLRAGPPDATTTTIEADSTSLIADGVSTSRITVVVRDRHGNPVGSSAGLVLLSASLGATGAVSDNRDGSYTATLTAGTVAGDAVISGTLEGAVIGDSAVVAFRAATPTALTSTIDADSTSMVANGVSTSLVTVAVRDINGNIFPTTTSVVTLATTLGTLSAVTNKFNGYYVATLTTDTVTGTALVTGTLNGSPIGDSALVQFVPESGSPSRSTITADSAALEANGTATSLVTVVALDANGKPVGASAGVVLLTTTLGSLSAVTDHDDGTYTATLTADTIIGVAVVKGTLNGVAIVDSAIVQMRPGSASPNTTTISADSASLEANGTSTSLVTVVVLDGNGRSVGASAGVVLLTTTSGQLSAVTDHHDGTYTATLTADTLTGVAVIKGTLNGAALVDSAVVQMRPGSASPNTTTISADSASLVIETESVTIITVEVRDAFGNLLGTSAGTVTLSATLGWLGPVTDHGDGRYTARHGPPSRSSPAGQSTITGTLNGVPIANSATVVFKRISN